MKERQFHTLTDLMALLTFALFGTCVLLVLLSGAKIYRQLAEDGQQQYARRTAAGYLTTRVRQADSVSVADFGTTQALVFPETVDGRTYLTRVYCYEGSLRELFTAQSGSFSPEDGEILFPAQSLSLTMDADCLQAVITLPDGTQIPLTWYLHPGKGALP